MVWPRLELASYVLAIAFTFALQREALAGGYFLYLPIFLFGYFCVADSIVTVEVPLLVLTALTAFPVV